MSEEIVFDCLHAEIVNYCLDDNKVKLFIIPLNLSVLSTAFINIVGK